jgi:tRNA A37 threonylcarbamoyladenosine modification protein TsaB
MRDCSLLIDCSGNPFILGLMGNDGKWREFFKSQAQKDFFPVLHELLQRHNGKLSEIKNFIICMGPGSYTGLRQAYIFSQTLSLDQKNVYYFYHADFLKKLSHVTIKTYVANAFKNTVFIQNLEKEQAGELVLLESALSSLRTSSPMAGKAHSAYENIEGFYQIDDLYEQNAAIFQKIMSAEFSEAKPVNYFRSAEVEFPNFK